MTKPNEKEIYRENLIESINKTVDEMQCLSAANIADNIISDLGVIFNEADKEKILNKTKETIAKKFGFNNAIVGDTAWDYAMICTHRTKVQIEMYEQVCQLMAITLASKLIDNQQ